MSFLRRVAGRSLRDRVRSSVIREELGVEPLLLRIERSQLRWLGHLFRMPPGRLPREVFQACPTGRRPRGRPRTRWRDYVSRLAWERLGVPPEELEEVSGFTVEVGMFWLPALGYRDVGTARESSASPGPSSSPLIASFLCPLQLKECGLSFTYNSMMKDFHLHRCQGFAMTQKEQLTQGLPTDCSWTVGFVEDSDLYADLPAVSRLPTARSVLGLIYEIDVIYEEGQSAGSAKEKHPGSKWSFFRKDSKAGWISANMLGLTWVPNSGSRVEGWSLHQEIRIRQE
ncbi:hypothetical protein L3Q82_009842 [Scortum barcoo]|uniref:Uncharacterized protein n=1 Tax=Scortum barcoo TaxID=214431 RepID=A0ACB8WE39_9TELE|nr:hypothetical protein L3Q82_009842 [Scortum barcoo]